MYLYRSFFLSIFLNVIDILSSENNKKKDYVIYKKIHYIKNRHRKY